MDVRQPEEFAEASIEGAVNIPLRELALHLDALPAMDEQVSGCVRVGLPLGDRHDGAADAGLGKGAEHGGRHECLDRGGAADGGGAGDSAGGRRDAAAVDEALAAAVDDYLMNVLPEGWGVIKVEGLNELLVETPPFIVDVRQPEEFAEASIEGAVNIPLRELAQNLDQLPQDEPIVVVCGSGHRSTVGMAMLQLLGFGDVKSMAGGVNAWKLAQLPLSS